MKALVVSDLHLEFSTIDLDAEGVELVVLAGDIHLGTRAFPWIRQQFPSIQVLYVPGNHEFYRGEYSRVLRDLRKAASEQPNVHVLDKDRVVIGDIEFLGAILWSDFALFGDTPEQIRHSQAEARNGMNDFQGLIRFDDAGNFRRFSPGDALRLHQEARVWLEEQLNQQSTLKRVVITHYLPAAASVAERFKNDSLSPAFASRLEPLVEQADVWIHGHTHDSFDYLLGNCRVICNPRGYVVQGRPAENTAFNPCLIVELSSG